MGTKGQSKIYPRPVVKYKLMESGCTICVSSDVHAHFETNIFFSLNVGNALTGGTIYLDETHPHSPYKRVQLITSW
eukprot:c12617_g1_i1 orf=169-396(+)